MFSFDNTLLENFSGIVCDVFNTIVYFQNRKFHRENGPAIEWTNGTKFWYIKGIECCLEKEYRKKIKKLNEI